MSQPISFHDLRHDDAIPPALLRRTETDLSAITEQVKPIIEAVRQEGDAALLRFAHDFDKVRAQDMSLRATPEEFEAAFADFDPAMIETLSFAIDNIRRFHEAQKPEEMWMKEIRPGVWTGDRMLPIDSVACYVPRGKGAFPSVVNMTCIPAMVAGVKRVVIITPPGPDGKVDAGTLVAAKLIGITEIYKCGGSQGVAAVAYGTQTVPKCIKIVGPGSPYVVAAKRLLAQAIDTGTPAGPSEAIILTDDSVNGALAALDLIIESEHGPDSSAYLVTNSERVAKEAMEALPRYWAQMEPQRAEFSQTVLGGAHGGVVLTKDEAAAVAFVNAYAPEHLEILTKEPHATLGRVTNAGEILLGVHTPVTLANYLLGPNAVLPTNGMARTSSPLCVFDFMKRASIAHVTGAAYPALAPHAERFATYEGFNGHARAVSALRAKLLTE
ncbi:histidinol dehydrogenase [Acidocella sp.]|uniref:histidinol dehydrogenase n=1 Tax=Acidocella sp. TaxID=50710 RepID=UPI003D029E2E